MLRSRALSLAIVLLLAAGARLAWLGNRLNVNEPDEVMYIIVAESFAEGALYPRYPYSPYRDGLFVVPPMPLYLAGLVFRVFGESLLSFRAMNAAFGVASVVAFDAFCGLYLGGAARVVAVLVFALSPVGLYESTLALLGASALFFLLVSLWAYVRYMREGRSRHFAIFAISLGATAACKQYGLLLAGVCIVHWCLVRWKEGGPPLTRLVGALALAAATFGLLVPWVFWRPYDALHLYLYRSLILHAMTFLRGVRGGGTLFALPYPDLVLAHGLVGLLGLIVFLATWRRRRDVAGLYGVLLAAPVLVVREARYLSLALPAMALFAGYLVGAVGELAGGRSRFARWGNGALVALLALSVLPMVGLPWRVRSGLETACRFVAERTEAEDLVMANYWRPVVERYTGHRMPRDWLDDEAQDMISQGRIAYVVLDDSEYTRRDLFTPTRGKIAEWVRESFPLAWSSPSGEEVTEVYFTARGLRLPRP